MRGAYSRPIVEEACRATEGEGIVTKLLVLFTPKTRGLPLVQEVTLREKLSMFVSQTPCAVTRTPVRLQVPVGHRGEGHHYLLKVSRPGLDCILSRKCAQTHYRRVSVHF